MFAALFSFLGGAIGRLLIGKILDFVEKWQEQKNEIERMKVQGDLEEAQHKRNLEAWQLQTTLGIKVVEAQTEAHHLQSEDDAFVQAVINTGKASGNLLIDAWNASIRPLLATICIGLWISSLIGRNFVLEDWDRALMSLALGIFIGGRIHMKGG